MATLRKQEGLALVEGKRLVKVGDRFIPMHAAHLGYRSIAIRKGEAGL